MSAGYAAHAMVLSRAAPRFGVPRRKPRTARLLARHELRHVEVVAWLIVAAPPACLAAARAALAATRDRPSKPCRHRAVGQATVPQQPLRVVAQRGRELPQVA